MILNRKFIKESQRRLVLSLKSMPVNLVYIVLFQAFIWGLVRILPNSNPLDRSQWAIVASIGLFLGIVIDLVLGAFGVFAYLSEGPFAPPVAPHNLEIYLLVVNAFFSYGIAAATLALTANLITIDYKRSILWLILMTAAILAGTIGIIFSPESSIPMLISWGIVIVSAGEFLLMLNDRAGPLVAMAGLRSYTPFIKLWIFSIVIGASYELVNIIFPFWIWLPDSEISQSILRTVMIFFGYFALFHAITVLWVLFNSNKRE